MYTAEHAKFGYEQNAPTIRSHRAFEYDAIAKITHNLRNSQKYEPSNYQKLVRAIYDNRKLWTILAFSVAQADNELPNQIKAQILSLSEFVEKESRKILRTKGSIETLIEINTAILKGLRKTEKSS